MTASSYDLRQGICFLLPDGVDPSTIPAVRAGDALPPGVPAAVVYGLGSTRGRRMARTFESNDLAERYPLWALPPTRGMPRALIPDADRRSAHTLLAPRVIATTPLARMINRFIGEIPSGFLTRMGLPLVVASRDRSATVRALCSMAPSAAVGCYLGNPLNEGRLSAQAFVEGQVRAIAKIVQERDGRTRVPHEARVLTDLAKVDALQNVVPRLGAHLRTSFGEVLITDAFAGGPAPSTFDGRASQFLARCSLGLPRSAGQAELVVRAGLLCEAAGYGDLARESSAGFRSEVVPTVITHGDFVPWNARVVDGVLKVFDWEYACIDGVPDWDEAYFHIQVGIIKDNWQAPELASAVHAWLARPSKHWSPVGKRSLAVLVLLNLAARYQRRRDPRREQLVLDAARTLRA